MRDGSQTQPRFQSCVGVKRSGRPHGGVQDVGWRWPFHIDRTAGVSDWPDVLSRHRRLRPRRGPTGRLSCKIQPPYRRSRGDLCRRRIAFGTRGSVRVLPRVFKAIEEVFFTNWRLAVLGTTGIVLSLASGWTTWDGMRNFTNEPILSFMVTFGIQGVMLVVAWLIGEVLRPA